MGKILPIFVGINYMYATLIEKNEVNSNKYFHQLKKINKKYESISKNIINVHISNLHRDTILSKIKQINIY